MFNESIFQISTVQDCTEEDGIVSATMELSYYAI